MKGEERRGEERRGEERRGEERRGYDRIVLMVSVHSAQTFFAINYYN